MFTELDEGLGLCMFAFFLSFSFFFYRCWRVFLPTFFYFFILELIDIDTCVCASHSFCLLRIG